MEENILKLFEENGGILKASELKAAGISYKSLTLMQEAGEIERIKNGYYTLPGTKFSEDELILRFFPDGVFTMGTALYLHGYLKTRPYIWSIAISRNTSKSRFKQEYPITDPYYTDEDVLELGVEEIDFAGGRMHIYSKDRLICDVLKYEERLERKDFQAAAFAYIQDDDKNIPKLLDYASKRRVLEKVRSMIGVWL